MLAMTPQEQHIAEIITPSIESMGYSLVRVKLFDGDTRKLQIMAERRSDFELGIDDCERISRTLSALLDVEDPLKDAYDLEVSSPGIDRPLTRPGDFARYQGFDAKVSLHYPVEGRRRFTGTIASATGEALVFSLADGQSLPVSFEAIESAKLVLNDKLLDFSSKRRKQLLAEGDNHGR